MRRGRTTLATAAALVVAAVVAPSAWGAMTVTQTDSPDPVIAGQFVTLQTTITNGPTAESDVRAHVNLSRPGSQTASEALYESFTTSQGTCAVASNSQGAECLFGPVPANGSVQLNMTVRASQSFAQTVSVFKCTVPTNCEFETALGSAATTTQVNHPTVQNGTRKIKLTGTFETCTNSAFTAKAKVKNRNIKLSRLLAYLKGPKSEFGTPLPSSGVSGQIGKTKRHKLKVKVPANTFDPGIYELKIVARRKNGKQFKRSSTFQVCGPTFGAL